MQKTFTFCGKSNRFFARHKQVYKQTKRPRSFLFGIVAIVTQLLFASTSYGQGNAETIISFDVKNTPIKEVFKTIETKADVAIMYENTVALKNIRVSFTAVNQPVGKVLDALLADKGFRWSIRAQVIRIARDQSRHTAETGPSSMDQTESDYIVVYPMVRGRVIDSAGAPLAGASVRVMNADGKRTTLQTKTDINGYFVLQVVPEGGTLEISYIGHATLKVAAVSAQGNIVLTSVQNALDEVDVVVNTGYYKAKKSSITGSVDHIDNELLSRNPSSNILERLEGVTSGLQFDRSLDFREEQVGTPLRIRGLASIMSDTQPLIILDNFPYEGDLNMINPNDIESVTVLKDASASAIWGAKAGNGVIVLTSKKGTIEKSMKWSLGSSLQIGQKPDLFYNKQFLGSKETIAAQEFLYEKGNYYYLDSYNIPDYPLLLFRRDQNKIDNDEFLAEKRRMEEQDIRHDALQYLYQHELGSRNNLSLSGGRKNHRFYSSINWENNRDHIIGNGSKRFNVNLSNELKISERFTIQSEMMYGLLEGKNNGYPLSRLHSSRSIAPYTFLFNADGSEASVNYNYNHDYIKSAQQSGLLDWTFNPITDRNKRDLHTRHKNLMMGIGAVYQFFNDFNLDVRYRMQNLDGRTENLYQSDSYMVRDLVNQFIQPDGSAIIPEGQIKDGQSESQTMHNARIQLNFDRSWGRHQISVLAGSEISQNKFLYHSGYRLYGYDDEKLTYETTLGFCG